MDERKVEKTEFNIGVEIKTPADEVRGRGIDDDRNEDRIKGGRLLKPGEKIYDLVDIYDDHGIIASREDLRDTAVTGQSDERILRSGDKIFDLVDAVEEGDSIPFLYPGLNEEMMERVSQITEKIAREMIPEIAARVIREEIEKLKGDGYGK